MILLSVLRTKIIEYCLECFFSKLQLAFDKDKILIPGKRVSKIIHNRNNSIKEHYECIIKRIEPVTFMGEKFNIIFYSEKKEPLVTYSAIEKNLEIFY